MIKNIISTSAARIYAYLLENAKKEIAIELNDLMSETAIKSKQSISIALTELHDHGIIEYVVELDTASTIHITYLLEFAKPKEVEYKNILERCIEADKIKDNDKARMELVKEIFDTNFDMNMALSATRELIRVSPLTEEILAAVENIIATGNEVKLPIPYVRNTLIRRKAAGLSIGHDDEWSPEEKLIVNALQLTEVTYVGPWQQWEVGD